MNRTLQQLTLALAYAGAISTTSLALAAQPAAGTTIAPRAMPGSQLGSVIAPPGTLTALTAVAQVNLGTAVNFNFVGSGHCRISLNSGDGYTASFEGDLPFTGAHMYSSTTMASYDAFKDYHASITASGNCKAAGAGPFTVVVRVNNPNAQPLQGSVQNAPGTVAGSGPLTVTGAASAVISPNVPVSPLSPASATPQPTRKP